MKKTLNDEPRTDDATQAEDTNISDTFSTANLPAVETQTNGEYQSLAVALVALHPAQKQRLFSTLDGIIRQGGMQIDTVLHLVGMAIQRELDA